LGGDYERLAAAYHDKVNSDRRIEDLVIEFGRERIMTFVEYWWKRPIFQGKRPILLAGVEAYFTFKEAGYINCIKTLYSEIEGMLRVGYFSQYRKNPSFSDLMEYMQERANDKFVSPNSLGFPTLLYRYMHDIIFCGFDLETGSIALSRHSSSHGVASSDEYTRRKALQAILLLDQMSSFLDQDSAPNAVSSGRTGPIQPERKRHKKT